MLFTAHTSDFVHEFRRRKAKSTLYLNSNLQSIERSSQSYIIKGFLMNLGTGGWQSSCFFNPTVVE